MNINGPCYADKVCHDIIEVVKMTSRRKSMSITPDSAILTESDMESLEMLEFIEIIKTRYGLDLLSKASLINDKTTPRALTEEIMKRTGST
jgi:hypothetical protein